jgi:hypothetical protein
MIRRKRRTAPKRATAIKGSRPKLQNIQDLILEAELQDLAKKANTGYELEYVFAPPRRFRFDACLPELRIAIEIDGGVFIGGRHTRGTGFVHDMEKLNLAGLLGYRVFRFTPQQLRSGEMREFMTKVMEV